MNLLKTMIAGAALAAVIGSPAFAQRQGIGDSAPEINTPAGATHPRTSGSGVRGHHSSDAYRARAQVPVSGRQLGDPRENALRECAEISRKYTQSTWGDMDIQTQRACMMEHGQQE